MGEDRTLHPYLPTLLRAFERGRVGRREFLRTATLLGMSAAAVYGTTGTAPARAQAQTPRKGGRLRLAMRLGDISDPHTYSWGQHFFIRQTLEHLTRTGTDNITRPLLLERWEPSADLKTWTLHLRRNVRWTNGRPFVADDVVWNLKRALDPATGSATVGLLAGFMLTRFDTGQRDAAGNPRMSHRLWDANAIEKVDDHTVRLNGQAPNLTIPEILYHFQLFMMAPEDGGTFRVGAQSTGPYTLASYQQGQRAVLRARPDYWGGAAHVEELELLDLGDDPNAHLAALASGQIDGWPAVDTSSLPALRRLQNVKVYEALTANTGAARMRVTEKPFDDPRVRKAMRLAIDPAGVLQLGLGGLGYEGEHHLVSKIHPDYAEVPKLKQDIGAARRLLAEAGHANGIEAEIFLKSAPAWESQVVQSMIEQWREAGIRVRMNPVPSTRYWEIWRRVPLGFTDWNHRPLGIMLLGLCFRTGGGWNESGYSNAEFDRLLVEAEGQVDVERRKAVMAKLQTLLLEDGPIVQPVYRSIYGAYTARMQNFTMHPTNYNYYKEVWLDA